MNNFVKAFLLSLVVAAPVAISTPSVQAASMTHRHRHAATRTVRTQAKPASNVKMVKRAKISHRRHQAHRSHNLHQR